MKNVLVRKKKSLCDLYVDYAGSAISKRRRRRLTKTLLREATINGLAAVFSSTKGKNRESWPFFLPLVSTFLLSLFKGARNRSSGIKGSWEFALALSKNTRTNDLYRKRPLFFHIPCRFSRLLFFTIIYTIFSLIDLSFLDNYYKYAQYIVEKYKIIEIHIFNTYIASSNKYPLFAVFYFFNEKNELFLRNYNINNCFYSTA